MEWVNRAVSAMLDGVLLPFRPFPAEVGLTFVSLLIAGMILLAFRATSDGPALAAVKQRLHAALFEMRLFNDDALAIARATIELLRQNVRYLRLSLVPTLIVVLPVLVILLQLQFYFGYDGLTAGSATVITVRLAPAAVGPQRENAIPVRLEVPPGLRLETPMVWIPAEREAAWRMGVERPGRYQLTVSLDGQTATKSVLVSDRVGWRAPVRLGRGLLNTLFSPAEPPIPEGVPLESIHVVYPQRDVTFLWWKTGWIVYVAVLSTIFVFVLRKPFGVVL